MIKLTFVVLLIFQTSGFAAQDKQFEQWKKDYAKRAAQRGLNQAFVLEQLKNVQFDPEVVKKDQNQVILSKEKDYQEFIAKWLRSNPSRAEVGLEKLKEHKDLLNKIEKKYGVDKEVIVSLWGVETYYGKITGSYDIIASLATLTYEGRRKKFFEIQLNAALRLLQQKHISREKLKGSWAGATGQCQFMPSNFNVYAQDFDGDGKKDIWTNPADIFASIANFLKKVGWKKNAEIGSLAYKNTHKELKPDQYRTPEQYTKLGFTSLDGSKISGNWKRRRFAEIPMKNSPVVLRGSNYKPLVYWNNSSLFAAFSILLINEFNKN